MSWIESHQELGQHPKTRRLARLLGASVPAAIGHLHMLWWWAVDYAPTGLLEDFDEEEIADACMWEGDAKVFVSGLTAVGFVDRTDDGLALHDWYQYAGRLVDQRKQHQRRSSRNRTLYSDYSTIDAIRKRDGDSCRYCGVVVEWKNRRGPNGGTYDHVEPNGDNSVENVVVACRACNSRKQDQTPEARGMVLQQIPGKSPAETGRNLSTTVQDRTGQDLTEPPDPSDRVPALAAPRPRKAFHPLTSEQRRAIESEFVLRIPHVPEEIDLALAHEAAHKSTDMNLYVRGWLRRSLTEPPRKEARNAHRSSNGPDHQLDEYDRIARGLDPGGEGAHPDGLPARSP